MDSMLLPFLLTSDESEAEYLLTELICKYAAPAVEDIVRSTIREDVGAEFRYIGRDAQDLDDIIGDVTVKVLEKLRRLKESPNENAINDFKGYVAVSARNTCRTYVREKYPDWHRLKSRLRYSLMHYSDFALWQAPDGRWLCGFSQWDAELKPANSGWINEARMDPERFFNSEPFDKPVNLLRAAFTSVKAPIYMEDLLRLVADILKITEAPPRNEVQLEYLKPKYLAAHYIDTAFAEGQHLHLRSLWAEIVQLPMQQRVALLFSVRDIGRASIVFLLAEIHIASIREIAEAVGVAADEFARILADLPLDDKAISQRLSVTRQKIISYRLSARRRLARWRKSSGGRKTRRSS